MPGWVTLLIDLDPLAPQRTQLLERVKASGHQPINQTVLRSGGREAGSLTALSKDSLKATRDVTSNLVGRARTVRLDADISATDPSAASATFVFLAVDLHGYSMDHDDPAVVGAIRAYLGQYLPVLGSHFVGVSTLLDRIRYAGGLTVITADSEVQAAQLTIDDPWRRLYPGRLFSTVSGFFKPQLPPPGPGTQRSGGGSPWPFHEA